MKVGKIIIPHDFEFTRESEVFTTDHHQRELPVKFHRQTNEFEIGLDAVMNNHGVHVTVFLSSTELVNWVKRGAEMILNESLVSIRAWREIQDEIVKLNREGAYISGGIYSPC